MINLYIIEALGNFVSALILVYFYDEVMPFKNKKYIKIYAVFMTIFYFLIPQININNLIYNEESNLAFLFAIIYYFLVLIYPIFLKEGRMSKKIFLSTFFFTIMLVTSFVIYIFTTMLLNTTLSTLLTQLSYERTITLLINRLIQFISVYMFSKSINFIDYIEDKTLYVVDIILTLNHISIFIMQRDTLIHSNRVNIDIIIKAFSSCIVQILSIYMLSIISKQMEEKFILKMNLDRKIHDEEIIQMYKEMNGWKHDFRNHMSMILGLLEVSTKDDVISYINEIDNSISALEKNIYTDNIAINSILASKMKLAQENDIEVSLDFKINSEISISNIDTCTILGNLLDNSIEACSIINGYKFIDLRIVSENSRLTIKISNNTNGHVNELNGKFLTTKNNDMHGIGIVQVDNTVKKYNGYVNRKHENNIFTTSIMIQYAS